LATAWARLPAAAAGLSVVPARAGGYVTRREPVQDLGSRQPAEQRHLDFEAMQTNELAMVRPRRVANIGLDRRASVRWREHPSVADTQTPWQEFARRNHVPKFTVAKPVFRNCKAALDRRRLQSRCVGKGPARRDVRRIAKDYLTCISAADSSF
jgi:hypothetical protein